MTNSTPNPRSSARRANITRTISGPAAPTTTCCTRRKVSTLSSVLTTTTRAPIGKGTSRIPSRRGPPRDGRDSHLLRDGARQGHGGDGRAVHTVGGRDRAMQVADRGGGGRVRHGKRPEPIHPRASGLSGAARLGPQEHCRDAHVLRPHYRRPIHVHRGQKRLGRLPDPRRRREYAENRVHPHGRRSSGGRRRPLGAAGAAWESDGVAYKVPAGPVCPRRP